MDVKTYLQALNALYANVNQTFALNHGLSNSALDEAEKQLGFTLAPPLRELWGYANGGNEWSTVFARKDYFCRYDFLSLASSLKYRDRMQKQAQHYVGYHEPEVRDPKIQSGWYQEGWLPFAQFGGGTLLLIADHSPSALGQMGQVLAYTHDPDMMDFICPNLSQFFEQSLAQISLYPDELIED
ncbi:Cell wall assembly/cell proliferation coordinating protein, KNR4-like [Shewanella baltica OS625]|uniref:SMI1/KNR4 family protein n=1 Tax=Shewanella baltica TaxID=62322 RepID=UPI000230DD06|nr:SMI1/KNR4 family protein [Shewanella baltica]EHC07258.1 Cell wall assembly/cell proliferation coordinating protein, KNR4-like [Shewanella baltica OS625]